MDMSNEKFDLIGIWNKWIDFCKQQIAYDLARIFFVSLMIYSIITFPLHYWLGYPTRQSHNTGFALSIILTLIILFLLAKKRGWFKDVFKDLDKEF